MYPMCEWASISAGITVLPVKSTRAAPAGACNSPLRSDAGEAVVLDQKRGVLDGCAAITGDEAGAFE